MKILRRLRFLVRRRAVENELAEEMRYHLEQRAADYAADGLPPDEARFAAQRRFGNAAALQERARDTFGWGALERFGQDIRLAVRQLAHSPGFTLLAVVTLGLGIGANTGMFGMIQTILFKPLPYPESERVVRVYRVTAQNRQGHIAPADYLAFRRAAAGLGKIAAYLPANASLSEPGNPADMAYAARITANLFDLLGIPPQHGRSFRPEEESPGRDRVVILSQRVWLRRYAGDRDIVGRTIRVDGEPHQVVGVMPATFNEWRHLGMIDFFRPLALAPAQAADRRNPQLRILVRPSPERAFAEVAGVVADFGARLAREYPEANAGSSWLAAPLPDTITGKSARPIFNMMIALSGLVLLIACSNLANLLLARTMARAREFAVRGALGASRLQLLRPLVAESLLLSLLGGIGAVFFAVWFRDYMALRTLGENGEAVVMDIGWPLFGWALLAALITALAFGLAPALFALRLDLNRSLKSGGRGAVGGRGHQRFRELLIVGQFAVAMTLLAAAGVFIRGLNELNSRRTGWTSDHLVTGSILLPAATYPDAEKIAAFHRLALERLVALPGVASASISSFTPFFQWPDVRKFIVADREPPPQGLEPAATVNSVSPSYFNVYGTRLLAGRAFDERDTARAPRAYIVSESTARSLFGSADPIGRRIAQLSAGEPRWGEVVGVVADVEAAVNVPNLITNQIYQPLAQEPHGRNEIAIRTSDATPLAVVDRIRETMAQLDPDLPVRQLQHADLTVERANYQVAVGRDIFAGMAALGLGLASLGIYGVIARTMTQRTGEFAIRLALGASLGDIIRLVLGSGVKLAFFGSLLGLAGGIGICRLLAKANPAMRMNSAEVLVGATVLLFAVALLACWLPARRAGKINAIDALRAE
jgi:putative ABC transport system permease protein